MTTVSKFPVKERLQKLQKESLVIDGLGGSGFMYMDTLAGGINATTVTMAARNYDKMDYVFNLISMYYALFEMASDRLMLVQEAPDILKAKEKGKLGIIFGTQNAAFLGENVTLLSIFHKIGLRVIQLTYSDANALGCGCLQPNDTGLTSFGISVVHAMNRLGILIDLSHTGNRTSRDAIEVSSDPVTFTHANPLAQKDVPRNKPDELIRMVAEKGGVIGLTLHANFCKSAQGKRPTIEDFVDHIDYVVQLVGIDHVGIGTDKIEGKTKVEYYLRTQTQYPDMEGLESTGFEHRLVEGFSSISDFPHVIEALLSRGYSDEDCAKIIGRNFYSLYQRVWKNSRS